MNELELVYKSQGGQAITDSLKVAETFKKDHKNVLRDIDNILSEYSSNLSATPMFHKTNYIAANGKSNPMYLMNEDGFTLLVMGYSGKKAMRFKLTYIAQFRSMKQQLKQLLPTESYMIEDPIERALRWAEEQKQVKLLEAQTEQQAQKLAEQQALIEAQAPKATFAEAMLASTSSCLIGELAKILTQNGFPIGQNKLFKWLRGNGYLCTRGEQYNQPTQAYVEKGIFVVKKSVHSENEQLVTTCTTKVTPKGQQYFINKLLRGQNVAL